MSNDIRPVVNLSKDLDNIGFSVEDGGPRLPGGLMRAAVFVLEVMYVLPYDPSCDRVHLSILQVRRDLLSKYELGKLIELLKESDMSGCR